MKPNHEPWYRNPRQKLITAYELFLGLRGLEGDPLRSQLRTFIAESTTRFIYESNTIEREGAGWHETQRLLIGPAGQIVPMPREAFEPFKMEPCAWVPTHPTEGPAPRAPRLILKYDGLRRDASMVVQHFDAFMTALSWSHKYVYSTRRHNCWKCLKGLIPGRVPPEEDQEKVTEYLFGGRLPARAPRRFSIFTERRVLALHREMARGFIARQDGGAGAYRTIPIMTGPNSNYPAPELVPPSMARFVKRATACLRGRGDPIRKAATISGELVLIHPFADFNGRLSRAIMNAVLHCFGFPFPVAIRAARKSRQRYFNALRLGRGGQWDRLSALIAVEFTERVRELNRILNAAGLPLVDPKPMPGYQTRAVDEPLDY